jgi:hypothetical protein
MTARAFEYGDCIVTGQPLVASVAVKSGASPMKFGYGRRRGSATPNHFFAVGYSFRLDRLLKK